MKKGIIACIVVVVIAIIVGVVILMVSPKEEPSTPVNSDVEQEQEKEMFQFEENGQVINLGTNFLALTMPEANSTYEAQSCAFDGIEKTYTYDNFEIVTCPKENQETILSIYFLNDQVTTKEGVKVGDSFEIMKHIYGDNCEESDDVSYTYTKGDSTLTFLINNDMITSIEYRLVMEEK